MEQKIVVHTKAGKIHKGVTHDFDPAGRGFHLLPAEGGGVPMRLTLDDLKALFWVRDYLGNRRFTASRQFGDEHREARRAIVRFRDGEEIWGTLDESEGAEVEAGFYLVPVDREDNNLRIFVIRSALEEMRLVR